MRITRPVVSVAFAFLLYASGASALPLNWTEAGDAGHYPSTAQAPSGGEPLLSISGAIASSQDVDMYRIYIWDPSAFFATTVGSTFTFDTQLFLFDANGLGVMANDDDPNGAGTRSTLPAGTSLLTAPGEYYLAVSGYNRDPLSPGGWIFPNSPFTGVFGPTGPGGSQAINGWTGGMPTGNYVINLRGAYTESQPQRIELDVVQAVPEPSTMLLVGIGLLGLARKLKPLRS